MDSLLAIFEKKAPPQNSPPSPTRSGYDSLKKSTAQETRREPAKPAPKEPAKPAPKEPSKPAPKAPSKAPREVSKPAPKEPSKPAPKEAAKPSQSTPSYQRPMVSKSISMLMEKLKNNPIEDEEEEEVPAKPAMPRRQSLGGINVRDLASKHESSHYATEANANANAASVAPHGHVKPVQMLEVVIPTIQEETEFSEDKRPSEVIQESSNVANAKVEMAKKDASLRDSFAMMMDEFDIDLDDMEEELKSMDLPSTLSSQPTMIEHTSISTNTDTVNVKTIDIACVPEDKTIPPIPTTTPPQAPKAAPPPAPKKPFQGAGAIDNVDFDSIEDLDIDSMVEEINREQEQKKQDEEQQQRESLGKVGYSFTPSR